MDPILPLPSIERRISGTRTRESLPIATTSASNILGHGGRNMTGANKVGPGIALILSFGTLVSLAVGATAFAQAGATGGTIGKTDKSVSGGESASEPHTPTRSRSKGQRPIGRGTS